MNEQAQSNQRAWATNTDVHRLADWLRAQDSVVLLTHSKPDGDAAGSTLGLARALLMIGVKATCCYAGAPPLWLAELAGDTPYTLVERDGMPEETDAIVICDTGSWSQLEPMRAWLQEHASKTAIIDHHLHGEGSIADRLWIETTAAAVCQPVAHLCALLLGCVNPSGLPQPIASPLYFGIGTDTGWFRHSNVTPLVLRDAAHLLEAGAEHSKMYRLSEQRDRPSRLKIMAKAFSSAKFLANDQAVLMSLSLADLNEAGASASETGGIIDQAMSIDSIRVGILVTEVHNPSHSGGPLCKLSMRSKELGEASIDVNELAQRLGGGGHARAAGAKHAATLDETSTKITGILQEMLS